MNRALVVPMAVYFTIELPALHLWSQYIKRRYKSFVIIINEPNFISTTDAMCGYVMHKLFATFRIVCAQLSIGMPATCFRLTIRR